MAETYFLRRENLNMLGQPRSWTDSLLWHHAARAIDLFIWLSGDMAPQAIIQTGPRHLELGCVMDMTIGLKAALGALLSLALSFNHDARLVDFIVIFATMELSMYFGIGLKMRSATR